MISIGKNILALKTSRQLDTATASATRSFERLSSGLRINHASDDAAGLSISETTRVKRLELSQAVRNLQDGISVTSIYDNLLSQLSDISTRQKELVERAASSTLSTTQRTSIQNEVNQNSTEFNRLISETKFNGRQLLDTALSSVDLQAGADSSTTLSTVFGRSLAGLSTASSGAVSLSVGSGTAAVMTLDFTGASYGAQTPDNTIIALMTSTGLDGTLGSDEQQVITFGSGADFSTYEAMTVYDTNGSQYTLSFYQDPDTTTDPNGINVSSSDTGTDIALKVLAALVSLGNTAVSYGQGNVINIVGTNHQDLGDPQLGFTQTSAVSVSYATYATTGTLASQVNYELEFVGGGTDYSLDTFVYAIDTSQVYHSPTNNSTVYTASVLASATAGEIADAIQSAFAPLGATRGLYMGVEAVFIEAANLTISALGTSLSQATIQSGGPSAAQNYFQFYTADGNPLYFWINSEGSARDPSLAGASTNVNVVSGSSDTDIATAVGSALGAFNSYYSVSVNGSTVLLTAKVNGVVSAPINNLWAATNSFTNGTNGGVDISADTFTSTNHGLISGQAVTFTSASAPGGLLSGNTYYAIKVDDNTFKLASNQANAVAPTPISINITTAGSGNQSFNAAASAVSSVSFAATAIDVSSVSAARTSLSNISAQQSRIYLEQADLGAFMKRIETSVAHLQSTVVSYAEAESRITSVDVAEEVANLTRAEILQKTSAALLAQANQSPALALQLLRNV